MAWNWMFLFILFSFCLCDTKKNISQPPPKIPRLETQSYRQPLKTSMRFKCAPYPLLVVATHYVHLYNPLKCGSLRDKVQQCTWTISLKARPFWSKLSIRSAWSAAAIFEREIEAGRYVVLSSSNHFSRHQFHEFSDQTYSTTRFCSFADIKKNENVTLKRHFLWL